MPTVALQTLPSGISQDTLMRFLDDLHNWEAVLRAMIGRFEKRYGVPLEEVEARLSRGQGAEHPGWEDSISWRNAVESRERDPVLGRLVGRLSSIARGESRPGGVDMALAEDTLERHVELVPGTDGDKARIAGHRIWVQDVVIWHEKLGLTADEIASAYPTLTLADVYAALAYYFDHRQRIEEQIQADRDFAEDFRQGQPSLLREKVRARYG
jgi:uncharacterized protein (DUF433 family)